MNAALARPLIAAIVVAGCLPAFAAEIDLPPRKPGQWQVEMDTGSGPAITMTMCLDEATDAAMMQLGLSLSGDLCSNLSTTRDGDTIVIDATCTLGTMKTTSHSVISGDFQSAYTIEIASTIEGAPEGMPAQSSITQRVTWMGACADDLAPGDMMMPGGMKMNVKDLIGAMGGG
jgi:hypothetical protein